MKKPSVVQIYVIPRPGEKSVLVFQHDQIKSASIKEDLRAHWQKVLKELAGVLK